MSQPRRNGKDARPARPWSEPAGDADADAVENVSSVRPGSSFGNRGDSFIVCGFQRQRSARDGFLSNQLFGEPGFIDLAGVV